MRKQIIILVALYTTLTIAFKLYIFYSGNQTTRLGDLSHLISLLFILPFAFYAIIQKRKENGGTISGKDAAREGMMFSLISAVILCVFNYIFFEAALGQFIIERVSNVNYDELLEEAKRHNKNITMEKVMADQKAYVESFTAFRDTTFKMFGYIFFGMFSSFVGAVVFKRG